MSKRLQSTTVLPRDPLRTGIGADNSGPAGSEGVPLTLPVPEAGKKYFGLSRNGSYEAAAREILVEPAHARSSPASPGSSHREGARVRGARRRSQVELPGGAGSIRVIAGEYAGLAGPAATFSELNVWDLRLQGGQGVALKLPENHSAAIAVLRGAVAANGSREVKDAELVLFERAGTEIRVTASADSTLLILSGLPIAEPIVGYGPFVMNTRAEIETAMTDFRLGKFGSLPELAHQDDLDVAAT